MLDPAEGEYARQRKERDRDAAWSGKEKWGSEREHERQTKQRARDFDLEDRLLATLVDKWTSATSVHRHDGDASQLSASSAHGLRSDLRQLQETMVVSTYEREPRSGPPYAAHLSLRGGGGGGGGGGLAGSALDWEESSAGGLEFRQLTSDWPSVKGFGQREALREDGNEAGEEEERRRGGGTGVGGEGCSNWMHAMTALKGASALADHMEIERQAREGRNSSHELGDVGRSVYRVTGRYNLSPASRKHHRSRMLHVPVAERFDCGKPEAFLPIDTHVTGRARPASASSAGGRQAPGAGAGCMDRGGGGGGGRGGSGRQHVVTHVGNDRVCSVSKNVNAECFDDYSPYATLSDAGVLSRAHQKRKHIQQQKMQSQRDRGGRHCFIDEVQKQGTSAREKPRASTWNGVKEFFDRTSIEAPRRLHHRDPPTLELFPYV